MTSEGDASLHHAATADIGESAASRAESDSGLRRGNTWQEKSGRTHGGDDYRFGDVTRRAIRKLGSTSKTPAGKLDELTELDKTFAAAAAWISGGHGGPISDKDMLQVYALYKQSTVGPCNEDKPSSKRREKVEAWRGLGEMDRESARNAYCSLADKIVPGWRPAMVADAAGSGTAGAEYLEDGIQVGGVQLDGIPEDSQQPAKADHTTSQSSSKSGSPSSKLDSKFAAAAEVVTSLKTSLSPEDQNKIAAEAVLLYSLFKQATVGPATGERPGIRDPKDRVKWDAWSALKSMDVTTAKKEYCSMVDRLCPGWRLKGKAEAPNQQDGTALTAELDARFMAAGKAVMKVPHLGDTDSLAVYAYFKQATCGPLVDNRPANHDIPACARWATWAGLSSMDSQTAKREYCKLVDRLASPSPSSPSPSSNAVAVSGSQPAPSATVDLDTLFDLAAEALKQCKSMSTADQLLAYSYFKQAKTGTVTGNRPGMTDPKGRAKWDAWAKLKGVDAEAAKTEYCALVDRLAPGWRPEKATSTSEGEERGALLLQRLRGEEPAKVAETPCEPPPSATVDLDTLFDAAAEALKTLKSTSTADQLLAYSYFKQAKTGTATGNRPGMTDPKGRAKWDAWAKLKGVDAEAAKTEYCAIVDRLVPGWRPAKATSKSEQRVIVSTSDDKEETLAKLRSNSASYTRHTSVEGSRALDLAARQGAAVPMVSQERKTTSSAQVEVVSQSIQATDLPGLMCGCCLALACRAAFRQRSVSRAAVFSLLAVCLARLRSTGSASEQVDSKVLGIALKDKLTLQGRAPSKPHVPESERAPRTSQLANTAEKDGWTVVGSSQAEADGWSDVGPRVSERRSK